MPAIQRELGKIAQATAWEREIRKDIQVPQTILLAHVTRIAGMARSYILTSNCNIDTYNEDLGADCSKVSLGIESL